MCRWCRTSQDRQEHLRASHHPGDGPGDRERRIEAGHRARTATPAARVQWWTVQGDGPERPIVSGVDGERPVNHRWETEGRWLVVTGPTRDEAVAEYHRVWASREES